MLLQRQNRLLLLLPRPLAEQKLHSVGHRDSDMTMSAWKEALQSMRAPERAASAQKLQSAQILYSRSRGLARASACRAHMVQRELRRLALRPRHQAVRQQAAPAAALATFKQARRQAAPAAPHQIRCKAGAWSTRRARRIRSTAPRKAPPPEAPCKCLR